MTGRLEGKAIIVAGAGGIGSGLATKYAAEGAHVFIGDIDEDSAHAAAQAIREQGGSALATRLDGSEDESIARIVALAIGQCGRLDGFHANFASFADGVDAADVLGLSMDVFDEVMRVNARGYVLCTRHAVRAMIETGGGSILYTSSAASYIGQPVRVAYAMSKVAIHALMRSVANRYGPDGIRANAVTPGLVIHARAKETLPADFIENARASIPLRRVAAPADVAAMCALLMSDEGNYVTGQVISVDGGKTQRQ
jgi:NAD(P)-dependent dehydrogenase (short-subunit alcohol dehydrogenase family)